MPVPGGETVQRRRGFTACRICGREIRQPIMAINGLVFCPEHTREFKHRRHEGVSTAELDTAWGDTLKNWRERPPELDQETKPKFLAMSFALEEKDEPWLIFSRSYPEFERPRRSKPVAILRAKKTFRTRRGSISRRPRHRLPDYVAVNTQTGEIRRFVDVSGNEVLDDLQGIHPAPAQAELAAFWGKRKPTGIRERAREQFQRQYQDEQHQIRLPDLVHLLPFPIYGPVGNPSFWEGDLTIAGVPFTGELYYWSQPAQLSRFFLKSEKTILTGNAYGPSEDELFQLLTGLQSINQQDDVLALYQREYDEDLQRLRSRFGR